MLEPESSVNGEKRNDSARIAGEKAILRALEITNELTSKNNLKDLRYSSRRVG
jgi:hypothetical protein